MRPDALHLVVSDMDGTLLAPTTDQGHANGRLTTRSLDCISRLHAAGVRFCIATGRPAPALQAHVDTIGLELPCVCFNGAALLIMRPGSPPTPIFQRSLSAEIVRAVCAFADAEDVCLS